MQLLLRPSRGTQVSEVLLFRERQYLGKFHFEWMKDDNCNNVILKSTFYIIVRSLAQSHHISRKTRWSFTCVTTLCLENHGLLLLYSKLRFTGKKTAVLSFHPPPTPSKNGKSQFMKNTLYHPL